MQSLANCPSCGDVFVKSLRTICPACYKEEEDAIDTVYQFLNKQQNREATINEIVEATEVEEKLIIRLMKENRLRTSQFPNVTYTCEQCEAPITSGTICSSCSNQLLDALESHDAIEQKRQSFKKEEVQANTYFTLNHKRKN